PPRSPLFPYTTLFRSEVHVDQVDDAAARLRQVACAVRHAGWDADQAVLAVAEHDAQGDVLARRALAGVVQHEQQLVARRHVPDRSEEHTSELQSLRHL